MTIQYPMWAGSHKRLLAEVLAGVPEATVWRLRWFDGVLQPSAAELPPQDTHIDMLFSHSALLRFAEELTDLNEIVLVGACGTITFELACEDSSVWRVTFAIDDRDTVQTWFTPLHGQA